MKTQRGAAMVEFALIALLFFMVLFGIIEFGRAFFTYNTLVEATRRGARVAAVCPASAAGIIMVQQTTVFGPPDGTTSPMIGIFGLNSAANVAVSYLDSNMTAIPNPTASYDTIAFVQVSLQNVNNINLLIPGISISIPVPAIYTILPSESLGRMSSINPPTRSCFGKS
jgi:Flp pilus assembly protein TadG